MMDWESIAIQREIDYLVAKRNLADGREISLEAQVQLLKQLKEQYNLLCVSYINHDELLLLFQAYVNNANVICDICEIDCNAVSDSEIFAIINIILNEIQNCYDVDLCRNAFVSLARLYCCLGDYESAENYICAAYEDYDYSLSTFRLYMFILDKQGKFSEMIHNTEKYLKMPSGYHERCSISDLAVMNITGLIYASTFIKLFNCGGDKNEAT